MNGIERKMTKLQGLMDAYWRDAECGLEFLTFIHQSPGNFVEQIVEAVNNGNQEKFLEGLEIIAKLAAGTLAETLVRQWQRSCEFDEPFPHTEFDLDVFIGPDRS